MVGKVRTLRVAQGKGAERNRRERPSLRKEGWNAVVAIDVNQ